MLSFSLTVHGQTVNAHFEVDSIIHDEDTKIHKLASCASIDLLYKEN